MNFVQNHQNAVEIQKKFNYFNLKMKKYTIQL